MEDNIRKFIYTSVGLVAQTTSKIGEMIDELIRNRKITEEEGKRIVEEFSHKTRHQTKDFEEQLRSFTSKFSKEVSSSSEEEIRMLKERIMALESKLGQRNATDAETGLNESEGSTLASDRIQGSSPQSSQKLYERTDPVQKVVHNEGVSMQDEVLSPEKKMAAEQERMQNASDRPSASRGEQDTQKANLSGPPLTPDKKVARDNRENRQDF